MKNKLSIILNFLITTAFPAVFIFFTAENCKRNPYPLHGEEIDTLKVVTLYGPTSYFDYRDDIMGVDYENVRKFAEDEGLILDIKVLSNINELIDALKNGDAHLAAYPVPEIAEYKNYLIYCGLPEISRQVLAQKKDGDLVEDVTHLIGKEVYVEDKSKFLYRLENLNEEIGGGILINKIESDTIDSEDILNMIKKGTIDYAVVDSQTANLFKNSFPTLDFSLPLSADQTASWGVANGLDSLAAKINHWTENKQTLDFVKEIYKRYYDETNDFKFDSNLSYFKQLDLKKNPKVSSYDDIFKKNQPKDYNWTLLAAIGYCESRFNPTVVSRFGATGLMQVMPSTSKAIGVDPSQLLNPEMNVKAASRIIAKLDDSLSPLVENPQERIKFVAAAYNSGLGHVLDAIALANKYGLDPQKWQGNVSVAALLKSRPEYYNDPVVRHGFFRGRETIDFVNNVSAIYNYLEENI